MMYFMFNNNSVLSENLWFVCHSYNMNICDWYSNISAIMNAISCFYVNQISGSQLVIVENVQRLIELYVMI